MVPKTHLQCILFLLSLLYTTCRLEMESDFDKWISWNMKSHQRKTILENKRSGLDLKLQQAERNKTIVTVSKDGGADFNTINEAIDSISPHNTRRVVVSIAPGVYR